MGYLREAPEQMNIEEQIERFSAFLMAVSEDHEPDEYDFKCLAQYQTTMEKLNAVYLAAIALEKKLEECHEPIKDVMVFAHVHKSPYQGPTYNEERKSLGKAIAGIDNGR